MFESSIEQVTMTKNDARLRKKLEDEREHLTKLLAHHIVKSHPNVGLGNHMADDASRAFDQAREVTLFRQTKNTLRDVENALAKLDSGEGYGVCERCGQPIDFARLKAIPWARYCLSCQRKLDSGH